MKKRFIALGMALVMVLGQAEISLAQSNFVDSDFRIKISEESVYVDDAEGNQVEIIVTEYIREIDSFQGGNYAGIKSINPEYPVGEPRRYHFQIRNSVLGSPGVFTAGATLTAAMKKEVAKKIKEIVAKKLGAGFIPGVNIVSAILTIVSWINDEVGNEGFDVNICLKYSSVFIHKEGHYVYGWNITDATIGTY